MVNDDPARRQMGENPVSTAEHFAHILVGPQANRDHIAVTDGIGNTGRCQRAYSSFQRWAFSGLRLYTRRSTPARCKCPAIGNPITPRPKKATFICFPPLPAE